MIGHTYEAHILWSGARTISTRAGRAAAAFMWSTGGAAGVDEEVGAL